MLHSSFDQHCVMIDANLDAARRFHIFNRIYFNEQDAAE